MQVCLWWTIWGSNPRPQRCERCALPAELIAHMKFCFLSEWYFDKFYKHNACTGLLSHTYAIIA